MTKHDSPDTAALLVLAEAALAPGESPDVVTDRIVAYTEAFDRWYSVATPSIEAGDAAPLGGIELLRQLETRHAAVMDLAQEIMRRTDAEVKGLRRKGKGMVAYTDTLPKRISTKKFRPG